MILRVISAPNIIIRVILVSESDGPGRPARAGPPGAGPGDS